MNEEKEFDELLETAFCQRMERNLRSMPSQTKLDRMFPVTDEGVEKTRKLTQKPMSDFRENAKKYIAVAAVVVIVGLSAFTVFNNMINRSGEEIKYGSSDENIQGEENYGSVNELLKDLDEKIYLPAVLPKGYEVEHIRSKGETIDILWKNNSNRIGFIIDLSPENSNRQTGDDRIYTMDGTAFVISESNEICHAHAQISGCQYTIEANVRSDLVMFIENLELH